MKYILGTAVIVVVILTSYIGMYLMFTTKYPVIVLGTGSTYTARYCDYEWMLTVYQPLASIEGVQLEYDYYSDF